MLSSFGVHTLICVFEFYEHYSFFSDFSKQTVGIHTVKGHVHLPDHTATVGKVSYQVENEKNQSHWCNHEQKHPKQKNTKWNVISGMMECFLMTAKGKSQENTA